MCTHTIISGIITWFYAYIKGHLWNLQLVSNKRSKAKRLCFMTESYIKAWEERARKAIERERKSQEITILPAAPMQIPVLLLNHSIINMSHCSSESLERKPSQSKEDTTCALICREVFWHESVQPQLWRNTILKKRFVLETQQVYRKFLFQKHLSYNLKLNITRIQRRVLHFAARKNSFQM